MASAPASRRASRIGPLHAAFVKAMDGLVGAMLALIVILTAVQVVARYGLNLGVPWVNETTRFAFIWLVMIGAGAASARGAHIGFDILLYRLRGRTRAVAEATVAAASILFLVVLTIVGIRLVLFNAGQRSPVLDLPMPLVYVSVPLGAALCLVGSGLAYLSGISLASTDAEP